MSILNLILCFWFFRYICVQPVQRLWLWNNCLHSLFIFCHAASRIGRLFPVDSTWRRLTTMVPGRRLRLWQTCTHQKQGRQWRFWTLQLAPAWWAKRWHHLITLVCYYTGKGSYRAAHYMGRSYKLYISPITEKNTLNVATNMKVSTKDSEPARALTFSRSCTCAHAWTSRS